MDFLKQVKFDKDGLIPAIAQEHTTGEILMFAFMNAESLQLTFETQKAVYFSRSRNKLWFKGEESGNEQIIKEILTDCDKDVILLKIEQKGGIACHTGRKSCFFNTLDGENWQKNSDVLKRSKRDL
jgi:phosphoribosyl-AMP cyclohydrolase